MSSLCVPLDSLVAPTFRPVINDIINCKVSRAVLKGGRNTTKSQIISEAIIAGCMMHRRSAIAIVRYDNKIEERLVNTFKESLFFMSLSSWWKLRRSPLEYVLLDRPNGKETNVSIKFAGANNPDSLKSYKPRAGSFLYIWLEEASNFESEEAINNIVITMARGVGDHITILTFNPPKSIEHWCNKLYAHKCGKALGYKSNIYRESRQWECYGYKFNDSVVIHHSTYKDIIQFHPEWLGAQFLASVGGLDPNSLEYRRTYLGDTVEGEANVFTNIKAVSLTEEQKASFNQVHRGLDMSNGGADPYRYIQAHLDRTNKILYLWNEIDMHPGAPIAALAQMIKAYNPHNLIVWTDSAVPTFIRQLNLAGVSAQKVKKSPDSVAAGIQWLQSLAEIRIDERTAPKTLKEFKTYEYKVTKDGRVTTDYVDANNHSIDATRYACRTLIYE